METERKIGEIFEFGGEWYQCVNQNGCCNCAFYNTPCHLMDKLNCDSLNKKRKEKYIFKKLEKVGELYEKRISDGTFSKFQRYKVYNTVVLPKEPYIYCNFIDGTVEIEIKQTKNMGERDDIRPYDEYFSQGTVSNTKHLAKSNLKPFDIEAAKAGKPVCTRDGRKARIICFDAKFPKTGNIVTLVEKENGEEVTLYHYDDGHCSIGRGYDLMMLPDKKEGWAKIRKDINLYDTKEEADRKMIGNDEYITAKVCWEE